MQNIDELEITMIVNDLFISYSDEGKETNPCIVFIHAFPLNKSMWSPQIAALRDKYRIIAYDMRGFGNSEAGTETITIDLLVSDLMKIMEELKLTKVILCGLSMGGYVALRALEKFPDKFHAVILCDTQCTADSPEAREKRMKTIDAIQRDGLERYADELLKGFFHPDTTHAKSGEMIEVRRMIESNSVDVLCNTLRALANRSDTCQRLKRNDIPVLILVGDEDAITPLSSAELIQSKISGSVLHRVKNSAHLSNLDNPGAFNAHLENFLILVTSKGL